MSPLLEPRTEASTALGANLGTRTVHHAALNWLTGEVLNRVRYPGYLKARSWLIEQLRAMAPGSGVFIAGEDDPECSSGFAWVAELGDQIVTVTLLRLRGDTGPSATTVIGSVVRMPCNAGLVSWPGLGIATQKWVTHDEAVIDPKKIPGGTNFHITALDACIEQPAVVRLISKMQARDICSGSPANYSDSPANHLLSWLSHRSNVLVLPPELDPGWWAPVATFVTVAGGTFAYLSADGHLTPYEPAFIMTRLPLPGPLWAVHKGRQRDLLAFNPRA